MHICIQSTYKLVGSCRYMIRKLNKQECTFRRMMIALKARLTENITDNNLHFNCDKCDNYLPGTSLVKQSYIVYLELDLRHKSRWTR